MIYFSPFCFIARVSFARTLLLSSVPSSIIISSPRRVFFFTDHALGYDSWKKTTTRHPFASVLSLQIHCIITVWHGLDRLHHQCSTWIWPWSSVSSHTLNAGCLAPIGGCQTLYACFACLLLDARLVFCVMLDVVPREAFFPATFIYVYIYIYEYICAC